MTRNSQSAKEWKNSLVKIVQHAQFHCGRPQNKAEAEAAVMMVLDKFPFITEDELKTALKRGCSDQYNIFGSRVVSPREITHWVTCFVAENLQVYEPKIKEAISVDQYVKRAIKYLQTLRGKINLYKFNDING